MLKDEQDLSHNGGGDARPLKTWSEFSTMQYDLNYDNSYGNIMNT